MKDKSNPLLQQDNKLYKRIFSCVVTFIYFLWTIDTISSISNYINKVNLTEDSTGLLITGIIIWILYTWFIFGKVLNKNARRSMSAMRGTCTYREMYDLLSNQTFRTVRTAGAEEIEESELWLKIGGAFVPKNFIVAGYDIDKMSGNKLFAVILLNGRDAIYSLGCKEKWFVDAINYFNKTIPHGNFTNLYYFGRYQSELRAQLREKFKKYKEEGNSIEDLINNFTDFSEGIDYLNYGDIEEEN